MASSHLNSQTHLPGGTVSSPRNVIGYGFVGVVISTSFLIPLFILPVRLLQPPAVVKERNFTILFVYFADLTKIIFPVKV
jgi:hypothetical protein